MSFQTDIEAITGSISSYTTEANSYLVEGVKPYFSIGGNTLKNKKPRWLSLTWFCL